MKPNMTKDDAAVELARLLEEYHDAVGHFMLDLETTFVDNKVYAPVDAYEVFAGLHERSASVLRGDGEQGVPEPKP